MQGAPWAPLGTGTPQWSRLKKKKWRHPKLDLRTTFGGVQHGGQLDPSRFPMPKRASASSTKGLFDSSDEDGSEEAPDCSAANGDSELRADSDANDDTERTSLTQVRKLFSRSQFVCLAGFPRFMSRL